MIVATPQMEFGLASNVDTLAAEDEHTYLHWAVGIANITIIQHMATTTPL